jgi:hypothetical protein
VHRYFATAIGVLTLSKVGEYPAPGLETTVRSEYLPVFSAPDDMHGVSYTILFALQAGGPNQYDPSSCVLVGWQPTEPRRGRLWKNITSS